MHFVNLDAFRFHQSENDSLYEPRHEISNNVVCVTSKASDQPAHMRSLSDQNLCLSLEYSMSGMLLTEHHLKFLSLKGGCIGSSESILVKISHCWKSHVAGSYELFFEGKHCSSISFEGECL